MYIICAPRSIINIGLKENVTMLVCGVYLYLQVFPWLRGVI